MTIKYTCFFDEFKSYSSYQENQKSQSSQYYKSVSKAIYKRTVLKYLSTDVDFRVTTKYMWPKK